MSGTMNPEMDLQIRALSRVIYFVTDEEDQFILKLKSTLKKSLDHTYVFNSAFGLKSIVDYVADWETRKHETAPDDRRTIHDALTEVYKADPKSNIHFYVFTDPDVLLNPENKQVHRRILNIIHQLNNDIRNIKILIFVGPTRAIPPTLTRYIQVVQDKGLTSDEILKIVGDACESLQMPVPEDAVDAFRGLTTFEIRTALAQSVIRARNEKLPPKQLHTHFVKDFKRQVLQKTDLLQYLDTSKMSFEDLGGAQRFKQWALRTRSTWTPKGRAFGLKPPKGVLCVGVWGCGKSLATKAMGHAWGLPVVQLEMGRLRSGQVGGSEANIYRALRLIEQAAPCVTGETEVTLADGTTRPIASLWEDYSMPNASGPLLVQCWNEKTLRVEATRVHTITRRLAEAFRIEAANGFYLNATGNHLHYVMRGDMPEWVRSDELREGDMLAVVTSKYAGNDDCTRFHPVGMRTHTNERGVTEFRRGGGGFRDACVDRLPTRWSTDLGWMLGVMEGDGFVGQHDGIGLTNTSQSLLAEFERILSEQFGLHAVRREHDMTTPPPLPGLSADPEFKPCWTSVVTNQLAASFLREARENILSAPPQVRAAFLAGWIDADGCVGPNKISLTVKHPRMWAQRQMLGRQIVQSLGIVPSKFDFPSMEITGSRATALAAAIGEFLVDKKGKASNVKASEIGFDRGMGFLCGKTLHDARKASGIPFKSLKLSSGVTWSYENGRTAISERHLEDYIAAFGDAAANLRALRDAPCRWVEIKSIESIGTQDVYDLACEGDDTHSFIANGLVTHNCLVWIDEAEKSLSGMQSSAQTDSGITSRIIGIFSTWLQETDAPVCLAMTANSLGTLPVEFVNRMDERFYFTLPSDDDRVDIIKIHLRKAGQDPTRFSNLVDLADKARDLVGREIEQAIGAAMVESFHADKEALDEEILGDVLLRKPRIVRTMADEIKVLEDWVGYDSNIDDGIRARFASNPSESRRVPRMASVGG